VITGETNEKRVIANSEIKRRNKRTNEGKTVKERETERDEI